MSAMRRVPGTPVMASPHIGGPLVLTVTMGVLGLLAGHVGHGLWRCDIISMLVLSLLLVSCWSSRTRKWRRREPGHRWLAMAGPSTMALANCDVLLDTGHLQLYGCPSPWGSASAARSRRVLARHNKADEELRHAQATALQAGNMAAGDWNTPSFWYDGTVAELAASYRDPSSAMSRHRVLRIHHDARGRIASVVPETGRTELPTPVVVVADDGVETPTPVPTLFPAPEVDLRERAMARIEEVDADFERRRFDICEVIEHHALFSMRFEPTADFEEHRLVVAEQAPAMGDDELVGASLRLQRLYRAAVEYAEHVGLDALRDPKAGDTALKMARTATDDRTPPGERDAAAAKLAEALRTLGLPTELTAGALDACGLRRELER